MQLVLDPAQDAVHGDWLRRTAGAYEWWYFDAVSDDGTWALACIWFLGNPFSPYYRLAAHGEAADPYVHNAVFFALYRHGRLHGYHFTRFPLDQICADAARPATLRFGPNTLSFQEDLYRLSLSDENANGRRLLGELTFLAPPPRPDFPGIKRRRETNDEDTDHYWLPAAPSCRVTARLTLREARNTGAETVAFTGHGYHDHNWGTLPFAAGIRDWYWGRVALEAGRAVILYHVDYHPPRPPVSHLLLFENGQLVSDDPQAQVKLRHPRRNVFGTAYAGRLDALGADFAVSFVLGRRLDSAPFYIRTLCRAEVTQDGRTESGTGLAEYFRPRLLGTRLAASATKARIVTR